MGLDLNTDVEISKFKPLRKLKKRRKHNRFYRKAKKLLLGSLSLKLVKPTTCSSFFVSFVVAKNFQKSKLRSEPFIIKNIEFEFEKTVETYLSLSYLEFLVGSLQNINYLNLKFRFVLNAASLKTYKIFSRTVSETAEVNRATSTLTDATGLPSYDLRQFKNIFSGLATQIFRISRLIKLKSLKKTKLQNFARLNEGSKFYFILKKFFKKYSLFPKEGKKRHKLISRILKMTIKNGSLSKLKSGKKLYSMTSDDIFLLTLCLTKSERFRRLNFVSLVTANLKPLTNKLVTLKHRYDLMESDRLLKSKIRKPINKRFKKRTKNRVLNGPKNKTKKALVRKKIYQHSFVNPKRYLVLSAKDGRPNISPSRYVYFLNNQLFVKRRISRNQYVLGNRQYLANLACFSKTNPVHADSIYLNLSTNLLTSYFAKFNTLLDNKISFKNQNKKLLTNVNVENYFNNFFVQHSFIFTADEVIVGENSATFEDLHSPASLAIGMTYMQ